MNFDEFWLNAVWSLAPSIGIGVMFWLVIRAVISADRGERKAYAQMEAKMRAEFAAEQQRHRDAAEQAGEPDG
jgi:hypothetical protein